MPLARSVLPVFCASEFVVGGALVPTLILRQANIKRSTCRMDLVMWAFLLKPLLVLPVSPHCEALMTSSSS
jgi:hypothetical protein